MRRGGGFVLVCVLWVLAILTVLTVGFGNRARLDRRAAAYSLDRAQAMLMARGAVQRGIVELRNKVFNDALKEEGPITHLGQPWAKTKNLLEETQYFEVDGDFTKDGVWYYIEDMERRIDLNSANEKLLVEIPSFPPGALRALKKRRSEGVHDGEGPAPFQAIQELRYMDDISEDDWFGTQGKPGLRHLVTVQGTDRVNVNTASAEVLSCIPELGDKTVELILSHRVGDDGELGTSDDKGFKNQQHLVTILDVRGDDPLHALAAYCKFTSVAFKIRGIATRRGGTVRATCTAIVTVRDNQARVVHWQEDSLGA